jgi:ABC-type Fe3+-hydroxamate transport system substrate-binding protein
MLGAAHRASRVALLLSLAACAERAAPSLAAATDDFGDTLALAAPPRRIVSLNPTTTELLFALGAGDRLVGRTEWDVWPEAARAVPDVGAGLRPNVEAVLARRPDLVLLYASTDNRDAARRLRAAGVGTLALKIDSIAQFDRAVRRIGGVLGDSQRATLVADSVARTLRRVRAATAGLARPRVFWHVWDSPLITIGGGSFMNELVEIAGGRNVYGDIPDPSPQVSMEDVIRRDPQLILAGPEGAALMRRESGWRALRAVREGRFVIVDTNFVSRPSVRLGEAADTLARLLHPGLRP